jgi:hypothetical protein
MIIKLAAFSKEEEDKIRKNLKSSAVKSNSIATNYAHPATILGGAVGGFVGSEIGDHVFGGNHMDEIYKTISVPSKTKKFMGIIPRKETIIQKMTPTPGMVSRLSKNIFRGGMGALGAGAGAYAVAKYRQSKEKK